MGKRKLLNTREKMNARLFVRKGCTVREVAKLFDVSCSQIYTHVDDLVKKRARIKKEDLEKRNKEIMIMVESGKSDDEIARKFGLHRTTISGIRKNHGMRKKRKKKEISYIPISSSAKTMQEMMRAF